MSSMNGKAHHDDAGATGRDYWRSLEDFAATEEFRAFLHREFPAGASELIDSKDRRHFLKLMGASMALAGFGLAGCRRWPKEVIAPYANRPEELMPGVPRHFATCTDRGGMATGLVVESYDARPIKVEGNPDHPASLGGTDAYAQASVLALYDPERSKLPRHDGEPSTWAAFVEAMGPQFARLRQAGGRGLCVLTEATSSPSVRAMRQRLQAVAPQAKWFEYEPLANDAQLRGLRLAFGSPHRPVYRFGEAAVIVSLDDDFLLRHPNSVRYAHDWSLGRVLPDAPPQPDEPVEMSRMYAFESQFSLTGANADQRVDVLASQVPAVAAWLASRLLDEPFAADLKRFEESPAAADVFTPANLVVLEHLLSDLREFRGRSIITAGAQQPAEVHLLAALLNEALGNVGTTVQYIATPDDRPHAEAIAELADEMASGRVDTLVMLGGNPVYDAPADLKFAERLNSVGTSIHLSDYHDETSAVCDWHVNRAHYLESWGDGRAYDGTYSIQQPLIMPIFNGRTMTEVLALVVGDELTEAYDITRRTFAELFGEGVADVEALWKRTLHDGLLPGSAWPVATPRLRAAGAPGHLDALWRRWSAAGEGEGGGVGAFEAVFAADPSVYDGRFANNGWLQELPDPLTKITWDNAVLMSVVDAERLGVGQGDVVRVTINGASQEAAVFLLPGQAAGSVTLPLGYGRDQVGRIGRGAGFNFYPLRTMEHMYVARGVQIEPTGETYVLATTQDHHAIDVESVGGKGVQTRLPTLVRAATLREYRDHPDFAAHRAHIPHRLSLWEEELPFHNDEDGREGRYSWGMAIDMNRCTGCAACVIACQAENNIPIVGKEQVARSREMHWLRIDRYFRFERTGEGWNPHKVSSVALLPVPCMHCENAPCESVCPVAATVHDEEGLNVMVYNRCIGTRYCSNNCPYKVRRFNYFDWHRRNPRRDPELLHVEPGYYTEEQASSNPLKEMVWNPEVTLRVRGVMEKCTYCVQRIQTAKISAKNAWVNTPPEQREAMDLSPRVPIKDEALQTACQQACPTNAIVFGDMKDADSTVNRLFASPRTYEMLQELNTKPRTRYMAKVWNPAVEPAGADHGGHGNGHGSGYGENGHGENGHGETHAPAHGAAPRVKEGEQPA